MSDIERRLRELEARVNGMIRVGVVTAQVPEKGAARVEFKDRSDLVSFELPVMVKQTLKNKDSYTPDIGEHVTCVFLPNGLEQGFILGAFYSDADTADNQDPNVRATKFEDGSVLSYDRQSNTLTVNIAVEGIVNVNCKVATVAAETSITLDTPTTTCTGNLVVDGSISYGTGLTGEGDMAVTGNITATGSISDGDGDGGA
ncbi:baseplate assembly protein [Pararheinheimera phage vB_PsoM_KLER1-1]|nr:baseplate assembly protein [Pararheinheimera phage vB_PsoM_KLER1-1]